jgi:hypothetical protein
MIISPNFVLFVSFVVNTLFTELDRTFKPRYGAGSHRSLRRGNERQRF